MSKSVLVTPKSKLFVLQQQKKGVFKPKPEITDEFNQPVDPLSYRDSLPVPHAAQIKTGFAFMDTSIRLIHEKKDDPKSPVKGIRFNSLGVEFRIEKSNVLGETPTYETTVLTNEKNAQVSYRMTPQDIEFALTCMAQECDLDQDKKLSQLYDLFKNRTPHFTPYDKKLESKTNPSSKEMTFEFAQGDKAYLVEMPQPSGDPKFWVKGFDPKNAAKNRQMTRDEVNYSINKIVADTPRDEMVAIAPLIQRMREHLWSMASSAAPASQKIDTSGTRSMNMGY